MERKKVFQYFWGKLDAGGAETFIVNLFENINQEKYRIDFCTYEKKEYFYSKRIIEHGGIIVPLREVESHVLIVRLIQRWIDLYHVLKREKYDVFHCNCDFSLKWIEMFIAKMAGVKVRICHSHNTALDTTSLKGKFKYLLHKAFIPLLVKNTTDFVACSEESAKWLYGEKFDLSKVLVAKNGINTEYFDYDVNVRDKVRDELMIEEDCILIGNVGRFTTIKNQTFIVKIIEYAIRRGTKIKACLIGMGELFDDVRALVNTMGLNEYVLFMGLKSNVRDYLMAFDCYVMPSLYEGLPVSGIEAQAAGLPCVVSDTVDKAMDISGNVSFLDLESNIEYWYKMIIESCNMPRKTMKNVVRDAGYDIKTTAKEIEQIYNR